VDVNQRALGLSRDNARTLGINDFHALTPEQVPGEVRFDAIWSNPPIRVGKTALHAILLTWLPRLTPGGSAYLVVAKNLGSDSLQRWLSAELAALEPGAFAVGRHVTARGFRLVRVHRVP
jgi:16S rRNA (guanine1207-N2)-methyltransferase